MFKKHYSPWILILALIIGGGVVAGLAFDLNNGSSGDQAALLQSDEIDGSTATEGRRSLQLETYNFVPGSRMLPNNFEANPQPGTFPQKPNSPIPTVIIANRNCTYTIGFWKTHAGFGPQDDALSPLLPIWLGTPDGAKSVSVSTNIDAVTLLQKSDDASNGFNKLYAQFLGVKLNMKSGAEDSGLPISETDSFLAQYNSFDWGILTLTQKQRVITWAEQYDSYNNGKINPFHCP